MSSKLICFLLFIAQFSFAQKGKVQSAWRALTDYEATVADGKPDLNFLNKAKEAIDIALQNEDTKNKAKTHTYKCRISYAQFQSDLAQELKKLEATVPDKNERILVGLGNTNLTDFETASEEIAKVNELDPKFMANIQQGLANGTSGLEEDELRFAMVAQQIKLESSNIASGKYKVKKYDVAADYFYKTALINTILYKTKDTNNFYNACIAASKASDNGRILDYNTKMVDAKIGNAYNYEAIYSAYLAKGDSAMGLDILKKGRELYPNNIGLLNKQTDYYLAKNKQQDALNNVKALIEKDPNNPILYIVSGQLYDAMANPVDKTNNKDLEKPANYQDCFKNAEASYLKGIELKPENKEYLYTLVFNLGALYNNYGGTMANRKSEKITEMAKLQKENTTISQGYFKKAIPYLEQALAIKSNDLQTMTALRKLYLITGDESRGKEMNDKIKALR
jgi:hypothetical protein